MLQKMYEIVSGGHSSSKITLFIQNHSLQDLGCEVLVANNAQGCFSILPSLWQLSLNKELNAKQPNEKSNFVTSISLC
jgi:hypothetical protein